MNAAAPPVPDGVLYWFKEHLVFDVAKGAAGDPLAGLPCLKSIQNGRNKVYTWSLPELGQAYDFRIGWEMGLAYLRANLPAVQVGMEAQDGHAVLRFVKEAMDKGKASQMQRDGFFRCIEALLEIAAYARGQLPSVKNRLAALDDATLRARCLAILDGRPIEDIFSLTGPAHGVNGAIRHHSL